MRFASNLLLFALSILLLSFLFLQVCFAFSLMFQGKWTQNPLQKGYLYKQTVVEGLCFYIDFCTFLSFCLLAFTFCLLRFAVCPKVLPFIYVGNGANWHHLNKDVKKQKEKKKHKKARTKHKEQKACRSGFDARFTVLGLMDGNYKSMPFFHFLVGVVHWNHDFF